MFNGALPRDVPIIPPVRDDVGKFLKRDSRLVARDLGRGEAEKISPRARYKYPRDEPVTVMGWDGYALDAGDTNDNMVMMRTYVVRDRLYRLLAAGKGGRKTKDAASRFINSFRPTESRPR